MSSQLIYHSNRHLANMSQAEIDAYVSRLCDAGMDDGPEWDRIYTWLNKRGFVD